jgi:hypothetical protein
MENVYRISNLFSEEDLAVINKIADETSMEKEDRVLGRAIYFIRIPTDILDRANKRIGQELGRDLRIHGISCAEYRKDYGQPNLPPHFDGDNNELIVDYQLRSNTHWGLGLDTEFFPMQDNEAIAFNPNEKAHWRPHKEFKDEEYVFMIFFRFPDNTGLINYSHKRYNQNNPIFDAAKAFRDSIK